MNVDVAIVGAGLSGLVAAYRAKRAGLSIAMFESAQRPGGVIGSERRDGVLFERGPNSGLDTTPLINALLADLGIAALRIDASRVSSRRYVVRDGRLLALPTSPGAFAATPLFSVKAKLRLVAEPFIKRRPAGAEESIAQFVVRRLGREFLDYAIEPFVAGIYAGDPAQLSVAAAFPRLHALEQRYGSLITGAIVGARERRKSADKGKNTAASFSFHDGMQTLTDALARAVGPVECGARVTRIAVESRGGYTVAADRGGTNLVSTARAVIIATPAYAATELVQSLAPTAADALRAIPYPPVTVVASAYRRVDVAHPLDGFGFLAPAKERPAILGALFSSSMFEGRAAADTVLLTSFVGGQRSPELATAPSEEIISAVQLELAQRLGATHPPLWTEVIRWQRAIPQYTLGHLGRIAAIEDAERALPGLFFCANYRGGVSIGDCVKSGHAMAERVSMHCARDS